MASVRSKLAWGVGLVALAAVLGGVIAAWWAWTQFNATPDYWQVIDETDPDVAERAADFETWISNALTAVREDDGVWQMRIEQQRVNEWLATRLWDWEANQDFDLPDWLTHPMVAFREQQVIAAAEVMLPEDEQGAAAEAEPTTATTPPDTPPDAPDAEADPAQDPPDENPEPRVLSIAYQPVIGDDGVVVMNARRLRVGKLWWPAQEDLSGLFERVMPDKSEQEHQKFADAWARLRRIRMEMKLDDGRFVQMIDITLTEDAATIRMRTLGAQTVEAQAEQPPPQG